LSSFLNWRALLISQTTIYDKQLQCIKACL